MLIASISCFLGTEDFSKNKDACFNLFLYKNKENRLRFVSLPKSQFSHAPTHLVIVNANRVGWLEPYAQIYNEKPELKMPNKRNLTTLALAIAVSSLALVGCQTTPNTSALITHNDAAKLSVLSIVTEESQKALLAQQTLKNAQKAQVEKLRVQQSKINHDIILVDYIGAPELLLTSTAQHFGYRYLESGKKRALPIVNFTNRKVTGTELVKDIATFIDGQADITLDHQNKTILLSYR
ncbi:DotD/TraH family lipoprotein [Acinetobacter sp. YH12153]|uniref:DotD/TraH family lipoprotein n=1 Tax=Acinetobacter sp. YH12153 TaxID=2601133 RepID=UPI0015D275E6|nr:DotD/TraH family lipoprotein [Acinetobacter sp. YH12153]